MKKLIQSLIIAVICLTATAVTGADTKHVAEKSESGSWELTLGGGGVNVGDQSAFGLDVGIATNPLDKLPSLWFGLNQGLAWEPTVTGSTDVNVNWSWHVFKSLYLNTGWSVGAAYDQHNHAWRTGPEATFQYYIGNAFLFSGVNYDIQLEREKSGPNGFRYSFGVGLAF